MNAIYNNNGIVLYNEDCLEVMKSMPDESVDLVCTDPPYKCTSRGNAGGMGGHWTHEQTLKGKLFENNEIEPNAYIPEFHRILKNGTHCYIMCNNLNLVTMLNVAVGCGFKFIKSLIWNKCSQICSPYYMNCFEYILMFRKGEARTINNCSTPDILSIPVNKMKDGNGGNLHDTEKPVELMKVLVGNSTEKNETVFEPFAGIGSTLLASQFLERKCIACEIDGKYADIIVGRLEKNTNLKNSSQILLF